MANPFTLALNGGGYTIFLFLLLPITLSYSVLRWLDLGDDFEALKVCFELTSTFAMTATMMTATMASWFIWDPGGMSPMDPVNRIDRLPVSLHALQFDPPIPSIHFQHSDPGIWSACRNTHVFWQRRRRRQWDPGIPKRTSVGSSRWRPMSTLLIRSTAWRVNTTSPPFVCYLNRSSSWCCLPMPRLNINNTVSLVEFHPGIASSVSVFHYCHPVMSLPTVPNIDT